MKIILVLVFLLHASRNNPMQGHAISSSGSGGLKSVQVQVPPYRIPGDTALLRCDYDLGNDTLYSVKWYKEHEEFYRFVPKARPQANSYSVEGVKVDLARSNSKKVLLDPVTWKSSGLYRCEVSAEAPSFASAQSEGRLEVVALPQEDPIITGDEMQYQIGDEIDLNCTSGKSRPASALYWYINEQQVVSPVALKRYPSVRHHHGLITTTLGLQFILDRRHFQGGSMKIKCVASISHALHRGDRHKESIFQTLPVQDVREALLLVESSSPSNFSSILMFIVVLNVLLLT